MSDTLRPDPIAAANAWTERVRANAEQVERFREVPDGPDFYGPVAKAFAADPARTDDDVLNAILDLVEPGETWLDIGAGGGRFGLPIARKAGQVIAVDPSNGMLDVLRKGMDDYDIRNIEIINGRWPMDGPPQTDVAFIANVGMDIENFGAFLDAMEASAQRLCVAVMPHRPATVLFDRLWPEVHGEPRVALPALPDLLALLLARGSIFEVRLATRPAMAHSHSDDVLGFMRRQTWVAPGGEKDRKLQELVDSMATERDGAFSLSWAPTKVGVVSWEPRQSA